jgi:hypothetical protein
MFAHSKTPLNQSGTGCLFDAKLKRTETQFLHFLLVVPEPVCDLMPNHLFHLGSQISLGTPQNWATKNEYQIGSYPQYVVLLFGSGNTAVQPQ